MADDEPASLENARLANRLTVRSPLHLWEKSGILRGEIKFDEYRVVTNLTLDRAAIDVAKHHAREIKTVEELGGENSTHRCDCVGRCRIESENLRGNRFWKPSSEVSRGSV